MYLSTVDRPSSDQTTRSRRRAVGANVVALGSVSLITDVSAEMVTAILPVYLVVGLHLTPFTYGLIDGLYTGATALLRIVGGFLADRADRRKLVAGLGYGLSAVAKLALLAAGRSVPVIGAVIAVDRAGKGLRTAPRDALITLSNPPDTLGRAFGVHRAMDSAGAFLGPLVALAVLAVTAQSYDAVFFTSACIAALGVVVLVLFVREVRGRVAPTAVTPRHVVGLLRETPVRRLLLASSLLGLVTVGDGFVYLLLQRREDLSVLWFPVLAVGTNLAYLTLAAPLGVLADRVGRVRVMLGGYLALAAVYLLLFGPLGGTPMLVLTLALHGAFYAATEGVLMALAGPVLPERLRTTGIAIFQTGRALAYLVSSVLFGLAWQVWGAPTASRIAAVAVLVAMGVSATLLRQRQAVSS